MKKLLIVCSSWFVVLTEKVYAASSDQPAGLVEFQNLIQRFINLSVYLAFVIVTIMFVYGAIKFITSGGDPKNLQSARQTMLYAVAGLAFMVLGWIVIRLVSAFTGVDLTQFCIGFPGSANKCFGEP